MSKATTTTTDPFKALRDALAPLKSIADAYDANDLDDEARRFWGVINQRENERDPAEIELYASRGGARLLTLADCFKAREAVALIDSMTQQDSIQAGAPSPASAPAARSVPPDILAFAALGAMASGEHHAEAATRAYGSPWLGAMPAADALGLTAGLEESSPEFRLLRSMFIHGFVCYLKRGTLLCDTAGNVISFKIDQPKGG